MANQKIEIQYKIIAGASRNLDNDIKWLMYVYGCIESGQILPRNTVIRYFTDALEKFCTYKQYNHQKEFKIILKSFKEMIVFSNHTAHKELELPLSLYFSLRKKSTKIGHGFTGMIFQGPNRENYLTIIDRGLSFFVIPHVYSKTYKLKGPETIKKLITKFEELTNCNKESNGHRPQYEFLQLMRELVKEKELKVVKNNGFEDTLKPFKTPSCALSNQKTLLRLHLRLQFGPINGERIYKEFTTYLRLNTKAKVWDTKTHLSEIHALLESKMEEFKNKQYPPSKLDKLPPSKLDKLLNNPSFLSICANQ